MAAPWATQKATNLTHDELYSEDTNKSCGWPWLLCKDAMSRENEAEFA